MAVPVCAAGLSALPGIRHGFFTRTGGVSGGIYAGLNCGYGSGDDREAVRENRTRAAAALARAESDIVTVHQVHSGVAVSVAAPWRWDAAPRADGLATRLPGVVLGIMTADCAPILFADGQARVIGAAHAGWRGAKAGIAEATVARMESLGADRSRIRAVIGPAIGLASYEVDLTFYDSFVLEFPDTERFFRSGANPQRRQFDLAGYLASRLVPLGLASVERLDHDTYSDPERLFSFRRATHKGEPDYGRQISAITLD
ncbi:MAG: peptidoglycan editing factor PgeF [Alphaproteobacteria bacterium]